MRLRHRCELLWHGIGPLNVTNPRGSHARSDSFWHSIGKSASYLRTGEPKTEARRASLCGGRSEDGPPKASMCWIEQRSSFTATGFLLNIKRDP